MQAFILKTTSNIYFLKNYISRTRNRGCHQLREEARKGLKRCEPLQISRKLPSQNLIKKIHFFLTARWVWYRLFGSGNRPVRESTAISDRISHHANKLSWPRLRTLNPRDGTFLEFVPNQTRRFDRSRQGWLFKFVKNLCAVYSEDYPVHRNSR